MLGADRFGESVGADSRVLRPARVIDAPVKPSGVYFFSRRKVGRFGVIARAIICVDDASLRALAQYLQKMERHRNPYFIGTSAECGSFCGESREQKDFQRGVARLNAAQVGRCRGTRRLGGKSSGVTVIFFPL
jgi:hypothetical protein